MRSDGLCRPFLALSARALPTAACARWEYDVDEDVALVETAQGWQRAVDVADGEPNQTSITDVRRETTDDS